MSIRAAIFALGLCALAAPASAFSAFVRTCHDGDTCLVEVPTGYIHVRLAEIDAPEFGQPYGDQARDVLCSMICGKIVDIEPRGTSYNRMVGLIRLRGTDISEAMVGQRAAWDYRRYDRDTRMPMIQDAAKVVHSGLWASSAPIPPWEWRREHRQSSTTNPGW